MIDLYGQCVQISVYDEDYRGAQAVTTVPALLPETATATDDTPSKPCCELDIVSYFQVFQMSVILCVWCTVLKHGYIT